MKQRLLIAGSGKMAWDIGCFFLAKDFSVHWVTRSPERKTEIQDKIAKVRRRTARFSADQLEGLDTDCHLFAEGDIPLPDIVIESTHESLAKKRAAFASLGHLITAQTLVFSNSSSLLPQTLHSKCLGAHFFFPVLLTGCVELIVPGACSCLRRLEGLRFLSENGLDVLEENEQSAFLVNRLLLPLQAACLGALQDGVPASVVDEASRSELIDIGQLSMMDAIGLDLIHDAVVNYRNLSQAATVADHDLLLSGLAQLLSIEKKGKKHGNGLLTGRDLPWPVRKVPAEEQKILRKHLANTLRESCLQAYRQQHITLDQLRIVCERIFYAKGFSSMIFSECADNNERLPELE